MKKCMCVLLTIALLFGVAPCGLNRSDAATTFKDVPSNTWYYTHIQYIVNYKYEIMTGYAGNFGPFDYLTVEQFIKITVLATGRKVTVQPGQHWGDAYIPIGLELGFVLPGEFSDYKRPVTRAEMARMIIRALPSITGESGTAYDLNEIKAKMTDFDSIPADLRDYVCKAYQLGILQGGSDKTFKPNDKLQRASAASVIHFMLDPTARPTAASSKIWTDAEFEAFMKSSDGTYVNKNAISKVENGRIYWKPDEGTGNLLIPETNNPGANDLAYNIVKIMAYYTKKISGYLQLVYNEKFKGGVFYAKFYTSKDLTSLEPNGDIAFWIYFNPIKSPTADTYFPSRQQGVSNYRWNLCALYTADDIKGFNQGMDRSKFTWTAPRYEEIFKQLCIEVYGPIQGLAFFTFALQELDNYFIQPYQYTSQYIGVNRDMGIELVYHYPDTENVVIQLWTDKPVIKK